MPEENPTPTPADVAAQQQGSAAATPEPAATPAPKTDAPPWGEEFDAEKAWNLVQNLRADKEKLQQRPSLTDEQKNKLTEYDRLVAASQSELEKAQEAATKNAEKAQRADARTIKAEIRLLAAEGFADPSDAVQALASKTYEISDDGEVDSEKIKADLADILKNKPHWAKAPESRLPAPNPAQGSSGSGSVQARPKNLGDALSRHYAK